MGWGDSEPWDLFSLSHFSACAPDPCLLAADQSPLFCHRNPSFTGHSGSPSRAAMARLMSPLGSPPCLCPSFQPAMPPGWASKEHWGVVSTKALALGGGQEREGLQCWEGDSLGWGVMAAGCSVCIGGSVDSSGFWFPGRLVPECDPLGISATPGGCGSGWGGGTSRPFPEPLEHSVWWCPN